MLPEPPNVDVPAFLAGLPLFTDIDRDALQRMAAACLLRSFGRGDTLFRAGDSCEAFQVVVVGRVKIFVISPAGQEKVIELIGPGHSFAEAFMFLSKPFLVNVQTLEPTTLITLPRSAMMDELERDNRFALRLVAGVSRRLHGLVQDVQAYTLQSGVQRIIGYLLRGIHESEGAAAGSAGHSITLPVSKATLASRLSLTPEYFSRVMRELEDACLIVVDKRTIRILDAQRLASYPD